MSEARAVPFRNRVGRGSRSDVRPTRGSAGPRLAEAAVQRARLSVVPRQQTRAARMPFVTLVTLLLVGGVVGLLLFNTSMQQASFAATALEGQATNLSAREQTLQLELDRLRDPQAVAEKARSLGMVESAGTAFLLLGENKVVGEPVPAPPSSGTKIQPPAPDKPAALDPPPVKAPPAKNRHGNQTGNQQPDGQRGQQGRRRR
jgi:cell division protein FtsB